MEDWVAKALARWPGVPHLYGWLRLNRRGRWLIRGEPISRPQIIDTINPNYEADELGCWFFQNGPQRGYVELEYAPLIACSTDTDELLTHTGHTISQIAAASLDENGLLALATEHGPALLAENSLEWALEHLRTASGQPLDEASLSVALEQADGSDTTLQLIDPIAARPTHPPIAVTRHDFASVPAHFGFVRAPQPTAN